MKQITMHDLALKYCEPKPRPYAYRDFEGVPRGEYDRRKMKWGACVAGGIVATTTTATIP